MRRYLDREGSPYLLMFFFLAATGLIGFLASVLLRRLGLDLMAVRYPLAVGVAYLAFLGLVGLWLSYRRGRRRGEATSSSWSGSSDLPAVILYDGPDAAVDMTNVASAVVNSQPSPSATGKALGGIELPDLGDSDGDGLAFVIVAILIVVAVVAALVASLAVLMEAPILLAEALVDGALLTGVAGRISRRSAQPWTGGVVKRTWFPVVVLAILFALVGAGLQWAVPEATTMGQALAGSRGK
jgi:hypothetical protein